MEDEKLTSETPESVSEAPAPETAPEVPAPETVSEAAAPAESELCAQAKHSFSRLGLGAFVILAAATLLQLILTLYALNTKTLPAWMGEPWAKWVLTFAPLYCIAMPAGVAVMRTAPACPREPEKLGFGRFLKFIPISMFLMYAGSFLGNAVTSLLGRVKGSAVENPLEEYVLGGDALWMNALVMVILAPLAEEYIFRRVFIDRTRVYGEKTAVLTSALAFGLFHGNLSQFFYAAALGYLLAYVYIRTGRLRYSAALHMFVNALGGVVAPWMLQNAGLDKLEELDAATAAQDPALLGELLTPGLLLFLFYALALFALSILGLVLLCVNARRLRFEPAERELPKELRARTAWGNAGMILLAAGCLATIVSSVIF